MSKVIKIIDETETQKQKQNKKRTMGMEGIAKWWEINDFVECLSLSWAFSPINM